MNNLLLSSIREEAQCLLEDKVLGNYRFDENELERIVDFFDTYDIDEKVKQHMSLMYLLMNLSYTLHSGVDQYPDNENIRRIIIDGDTIGTIYHQVVMASGEHDLNRLLVSEYKKMCINKINGRNDNLIFNALTHYVQKKFG